jgi:Arc/MetJ-type ribon-helix-helix transcriptional regulator
MTVRDTVDVVAERAISVRLDDKAADALAELVGRGHSQSQAIRLALIEAADARRGLRSLAAEARYLMESEDDRREAQAVLELMDSLRAPWPDD